MWIVGVVAVLVSGCGDDGAAVDAGVDGGVDAGPVERDAGPTCEPECGVGRLCCPGEDGAPACIDVANDDRNCGECGMDCVALQAGTHCEAGRCVCGAFELGCAGRTICCPPRPGQTMPYCADLARGPDDCGACNNRCDPTRADRCDGSRCLCGEGARDQCAGTPEDTCCPDSAGFSQCVDTTTNALHCGACGNTCPSGVCSGGTCE